MKVFHSPVGRVPRLIAMKRILSLCIALLALARIADAHAYSPWPYYLAGADQVCLAQVTSVKANKITFAVTEILRGKPAAGLVLVGYLGNDLKYTPKSEWLLVSCPTGFKGTVGYAIKGDCGWIPGSVIRSDGKAFVPCSFPILPFPDGTGLDTLPDGTKGLTLDHIKQLLQQTAKKQ